MLSPEQKYYLPQEIYNLIIDQVKADPPTLYKLCLVSSCFLSQAQRTLYHNLNVSDDKLALCSGGVIDAARAMSLFRTLTVHNPTLAKFVRSFYHRLASFGRSDNGLYWKLLQQALQLMVNLRRLTITACMSPLLDLYTQCSFRLEVFGSDRPCDGAPLYHATLQHLASQPDLKSLYAWRFHHEGQLSDKFCPNLDALTGDRRTIESILPGRSVTRLTWIPDSGEDILTPPRGLTTELSNIRVLSLGGFYRRPCLRLVIPYLPLLEVLRLFGESQGLKLLNELEFIPEFANLRVFIWTAGFATSVKWFPFGNFGNEEGIDAQHALVETWFSNSHTLKEAYFHVHEATSDQFQCYRRWRRGERQPTKVGYEDAVPSHDVVSWYS